jgi:hypothetical protein
MARFKENAPTITKDHLVDFTTARGRTTYTHATLGNVVAQVVKGLATVRISHRWAMTQEAARITVSCELTHADGHTESVQLSAAPDESGGKNSIQAVASTVSYLQRYTLLAITGLATSDQDDDARTGGGDEPERISESQAADLTSLLQEVNAHWGNFLKYAGVDRIEDILASDYSRLVRVLEQKRAGQPAKAST